MRRRRRRSSFAQRGRFDAFGSRWVVIGVGAAALIAVFLFLMRQADVLAPEPTAQRIELPDAFKN